MGLEMAGEGFNLLIWGVLALLASIANVMLNKKRKQWGFSAKFLFFYLPIVISSVAIIAGLRYIFMS
jgi:hypothetical protein